MKKIEAELNFKNIQNQESLWDKYVREWSLILGYNVEATKMGDSKTEDDHLTSAKNANED